jgi:hypothetical protein
VVVVPSATLLHRCYRDADDDTLPVAVIGAEHDDTAAQLLLANTTRHHSVTPTTTTQQSTELRTTRPTIAGCCCGRTTGRSSAAATAIALPGPQCAPLRRRLLSQAICCLAYGCRRHGANYSIIIHCRIGNYRYCIIHCATNETVRLKNSPLL